MLLDIKENIEDFNKQALKTQREEIIEIINNSDGYFLRNSYKKEIINKIKEK